MSAAAGRGPAAPRFFRTPAAFRAWLARHHASAKELWVGFYKKETGRASITWPESVDEALCYGWIDGIRKGVDAASYVIRFTPRRPGSKWSAINLRKIQELTAAGRMHAAGSAVHDARDPARAGYSYERREAALSPAFARRFKADRGAWAFFAAQPPGVRRLSIHYVMSAKQEATRLRRLTILITCSARGERLRGLEPAPARLAGSGPRRGSRGPAA